MKKMIINQRGFSLIEIITVILLVGLTSVSVIINFTRNEQNHNNEVGDFMSNIENAYYTSIISGEVLGLFLDKDGYSFHNFRQGVWKEIISSEYLEKKKFTKDFNVSKGRVRQSNNHILDNNAVLSFPSIIFFPNGFHYPFSFIVNTKDNRIVITGNSPVEYELKYE